MDQGGKAQMTVVQAVRLLLLLGVALVVVGGCARVAADIEGYSPSELVEVELGEPVNLSVTISNTGNRARSFIVRARVLDSQDAVVRSYEEKLEEPLEPDQNKTITWEHDPRREGEFFLQFSLWGDEDTMLDQQPDVSERFIVVRDEEPEPDEDEPAEAKFEDGDRVRVTASGLRVRVSPGLDESPVASPYYEGTMTQGSTGRIVDGPVERDDHIWWRIDYDIGVVGWSAQEYLEHEGGNG
ncbi:MAG: hypothetical protein R6U88_02600 [Candidatus Bipolaricaulota bacterium]